MEPFALVIQSVIDVMFQSLVGFKINWNLAKMAEMEGQEEFQSLVGFKINWNKIFLVVYLMMS